MTIQDVLANADNFAGFAALINGMLLWPVVRSIRAEQSEVRSILGKLIKSLRLKPTPPARKRTARKRK